MQSTELTKPVSLQSLLTQFESRFGQTLKLEGMDKNQLEDVANHIRTKIHTITDNLHFGQELNNNEYQKNQSMLDIVNQAIREYNDMNATPMSQADQQQMVKRVKQSSTLSKQDKEKL